jgi:hypothetical protein
MTPSLMLLQPLGTGWRVNQDASHPYAPIPGS